MKPKRTFLFAHTHKVPPVQDRTRVYQGRREMGNAIVTVHDQPEGHQPRLLPERQDLRCHSVHGFDWGVGDGRRGYGGAGPSQLALALLADYLGDDQKALALECEFKFHVIAALPHDWWKLTGHDIDKALKRIQEHSTALAEREGI
ncbi:MAG TPA: DUF6166 domain-containing protein [Verrucomicrobiae bacterium]|jgi:hypothetical protein|nr:DUF6166 domain-containing protein [Verrucomicrobiae bacterium]